MEPLLEPCPFWTSLEAEHREWLSAFDPRYLRKWENLRNGDREAGLCEAAARRWLVAQGVIVQPNEDLEGTLPTGAAPRPDFRCSHRGSAFYVEVTCIQVATVVANTGLPHPPQPGPRSYGGLNAAIFNKCLDKYKQYTGTDLPTLLAIGTFHLSASVLCVSQKFADMLLTGETSVSFVVNTATGEGVSEAFQTTKLRAASFLKPVPPSIREARTALSGLLLCGFGGMSPNVLGILHPVALRPFDPSLLPNIRFGEVQIDHVTGQLRTVWPGEVESEEDDFVP